ncbi:hypothetical protein LR48_Vigan09g059400 [Vigna angularis]|uniref:Putative plant transposon protein domain-containing protein n=1 Tax=Phaseolus angularis TaxID=3914 RepID=A0A0L9VA10_PHAAN|nr:hypothetical protein LR48_Vigan09g059400 [Vigna angularis]
MESEKTSKSAKGEAATTAQRHFTAERHSEIHVGSAEGVLCLMSAECNFVKNLTIWALNSTKVISTTGGNLTQAWIKANFGTLSDHLIGHHHNNGRDHNNGSNNPFYQDCQFALCMEEGVDFDDVERVLCVPREHFQRNRTGSVVNIRRTDLTPLAKYWMAFSHANIQPCSHVSDITLSRTLLLYCVIRNLNVNIGQVIADEIRMCANTTNNKAPLGHPSLITHLCKIAGVDTSAPPFERPRKAIDEAYYRQYCGGEEAAQPVPPRRTRRERGQAQSQASAKTNEAEPFQMRDMYMSLIGAQLQSIHRGQVATAEMIVGMYDTPPAHRWTMEEFHNVVAWPEEQEQGDRAEAAEASAMEMEEDDADDDEDDAFEDAEDEEEEEDTDDSSN